MSVERKPNSVRKIRGAKSADSKVNRICEDDTACSKVVLAVSAQEAACDSSKAGLVAQRFANA